MLSDYVRQRLLQRQRSYFVNKLERLTTIMAVRKFEQNVLILRMESFFLRDPIIFPFSYLEVIYAEI